MSFCARKTQEDMTRELSRHRSEHHHHPRQTTRLSDLRRSQRYLPDEDVNPEKLDNLLIALDERGIELVEAPPKSSFEDRTSSDRPPRSRRPTGPGSQDALGPPPPEEIRKLDSDPIRMYLSQMAEIPLLVARGRNLRWPRRSKSPASVFAARCSSCDFAMQQRWTRWNGPRGRTAVRPHDQGLADRAADQGADPGADAAQPARRCNICWSRTARTSRG